MMTELGFSPKLNPNAPPQFHDYIFGCICGAVHGNFHCDDPRFNGVKIANSGMMHVSSTVVTQDEEGWFRVICAECGRESKIASADMNGAIRLWNQEMYNEQSSK
jgi:hypothetical protein